MPNIPLESIVTSELFCFLVGPEQKKFLMHSALVAKFSKPFDVMINGLMNEAREGSAHLPEIDEAIFMRFFQYAYRGDYEVADLKFSNALSGGNPAHLMTCDECEENQIYCQCNWCNHCRLDEVRNKFSLKQAQLDFSYDGNREPITCGLQKESFMREFLDDARLTCDMVCTRANDENLGRWWSDVFLAHAKVYVMADCWGVEALAELSKNKIHQILVVYDLEEETDPMISLVDYVCENTTDEGCHDILRDVLYRYCTIHVTLLSENEQFRKLLRARGDLSSAIIHHFVKVQYDGLNVVCIVDTAGGFVVVV